MLRTIEWTGHSARLLDQTRLPTETVFVEITNEREMWDAIKRLVIRGAPAIGIAAAFGVYLGIKDVDESNALSKRLNEVCDYLATSRPTAVNLFWALDRMRKMGARKYRCTPDRLPKVMKAAMLNTCKEMIREDDRVCRAIGKHGLSLLKSRRGKPLNVLTHCNAGGLATAAYGTALAPIYVGKTEGHKFHVFVDETRPLLQGSRITAYELQRNGIPATLICDNMAATVMSQGKVDAVIVGTDRVAANGDVANKIGTHGVAILARHFKIPFYVAAPTSSIDLSLKTGAEIPIEERSAAEITHAFGKQTAPDEMDVYNPAFDVTPAKLVTAIITENGVATAPYQESLRRLCVNRGATKRRT